jgi:hypothetical protein
MYLTQRAREAYRATYTLGETAREHGDTLEAFVGAAVDALGPGLLLATMAEVARWKAVDARDRRNARGAQQWERLARRLDAFDAWPDMPEVK